MTKMRWAKDAVSINRSGVTFKMRLPKRCRFVCVMRGMAPQVLPITETGTYEISLDAISTEATFPALVFTVPKKAAEMFSKVLMTTVDSMLDQAIATIPKPLPN